MGFFDGKSDVGHDSHHRKSHGSSHSVFGISSSRPSMSRHNSHKSDGGIFGSGSGHHNKSTSSFFSIGGKSHKRAAPRTSYLKKMYKQLRRLLRDLIYYLKRHPMKVFMLVIMPLITGGALTGLLKQFGIRMPPSMTKMFGIADPGFGKSRDGGLQFERTHYEGHGESGGLGTALNLAKLFM